MKSTRRDFLGDSAKLVASGVLGAAVLGKTSQAVTTQKSQPASTQPSLIPTRTLGRTGLKITTVSLGSIGTNENTVRYAISKGINFLHASLGYAGGKSIRELGRAIKGQRKKVYLGLKVTWDWRSDDALNDALKRLGTDYVDVLFYNIHGDPKRVKSPEAKSAFERWKKQGKAKFLGLTTHGGMLECMKAALDTGWYDCLMPSYPLAGRKEYLPIFKACEKKNVGFIAMKTKLREKDPKVAQAFLRDKAVTTICRTMKSLKAVDAYISGAKLKVSEASCDQMIKLAGLTAVGRCTMCARCTEACKGSLAVNDIVRSVDYYVDTINDYDAGRENYIEIADTKNSSRCLDCGTCERACPSGVPIRHFLARSKELFA